MLVAQRVHALPEPGVPVRHQLAVARDVRERLALPCLRIVDEVLANPRLADEESAADPVVEALRLLEELVHLLAVEIHVAVEGDRPDDRYRDQLAVRAVELEQTAQVDVRDAVAVGEHERPVVEERQRASDAPAGRRLEPRLHQVDLPVELCAVVVEDDVAALEVDREAVRHRPIVHDEVLDDVALVAERQHELLEPVMRVVAHDVPQDRKAADLDHGLRDQRRFLGQSRPAAAREYHRLHRAPPPTRTRPQLGHGRSGCQLEATDSSGSPPSARSRRSRTPRSTKEPWKRTAVTRPWPASVSNVRPGSSSGATSTAPRATAQPQIRLPAGRAGLTAIPRTRPSSVAETTSAADGSACAKRPRQTSADPTALTSAG